MADGMVPGSQTAESVHIFSLEVYISPLQTVIASLVYYFNNKLIRICPKLLPTTMLICESIGC